ncbi:MAG: OmpA family protein [Bacteroidia bacterium]
MKHLLLSIALLSSLTACVSQKQHDAVVSERDRFARESQQLNQKFETLTGQHDALSTELETLRAEKASLENDTAAAGLEIRQAQQRIKSLNQQFDELLKTNETIANNSMTENARLARELKQNELLVKRKEGELAQLETRLTALQTDLEAREKKVNELQATLDAKDAVVKKLRDAVAQALLGFQNSGLTVVEKNGKVYVSLSEQLLFKTGSATVDPRGRQAITELAKVLETNPDISIMVEGHTDDQGSDEVNWDLSVRRATTIVKIITDNQKIDPARITAAGRGKHMPLDPAKTAEARAKNRRTEIILTPRLDDLFRIIDSN